jgi:tetratricopeptide (TPR) repeat protein
MPDSKSHYHILQIENGADLDAIKRAYRQQVRRFHPDQYVAERVRLQKNGDQAALQRLEEQIERAKHMTQRINEAYGVLSDPARRALYDRSLSQIRQQEYQTHIRQQRARQDADDGRRTVKTRQHRAPAAPKADKLPWAILIGFVLVLVFTTAAFSTFLSSLNEPFTRYVPNNATAEGVITSRDLQATANAEHATTVARMTLVARPTATPRSLQENIRAAQNLYDLGIYDHAIDLFNRAIEQDQTNDDLYLQRARSYAALFQQGDAQAGGEALRDYNAALNNGGAVVPIQRERGLLYYDLWQLVKDPDHLQAALLDLQAYRSSDPDDSVVADTIRAIESQLNKLESSGSR